MSAGRGCRKASAFGRAKGRGFRRVGRMGGSRGVSVGLVEDCARLIQGRHGILWQRRVGRVHRVIMDKRMQEKGKWGEARQVRVKSTR